MTRLPFMLNDKQIGTAEVREQRVDGNLRIEVTDIQFDPGYEELAAAMMASPADLQSFSINRNPTNNARAQGPKGGSNGVQIERHPYVCPECHMHDHHHAPYCRHNLKWR